MPAFPVDIVLVLFSCYSSFTAGVKLWWEVVMQVNYKNRQIEKICTNASAATKKYGKRTAGLIHQRVDELYAADSVEMLVQFRIGRCHQLVGDRKGQFAMDLEHPLRLVFEVIRDEIQIAEIQEIVDYH